MLAVLIMLLLAPAPQTTANAPTGRADAGKAAWGSGKISCGYCHGKSADGGFGPDLAGRGLSFDQFKRAVRVPWGRMPAYDERQLPDQDLADVFAYTQGLPKVAQPAAPRYAALPQAPVGDKLTIDVYGCVQCHQQEMTYARRHFGGEGYTFEWFMKNVYEHTEEYPTGRMGNFSRERLPESQLREIWRFLTEDLGIRASIDATLSGPSNGNSYTLTLANTGIAGKGIAAEDLTISVSLPADVKVVNTTGAGYKGTMQTNGKQTAVFTVPRLAAGDKQTFGLTLSAPADLKGSAVTWMKPEQHRPANVLKYPGFPDHGDKVDIKITAAKTTTTP